MAGLGIAGAYPAILTAPLMSKIQPANVLWRHLYHGCCSAIRHDQYLHAALPFTTNVTTAAGFRLWTHVNHALGAYSDRRTVQLWFVASRNTEMSLLLRELAIAAKLPTQRVGVHGEPGGCRSGFSCMLGCQALWLLTVTRS